MKSFPNFRKIKQYSFLILIILNTFILSEKAQTQSESQKNEGPLVHPVMTPSVGVGPVSKIP